jgi:hypothetical protein
VNFAPDSSKDLNYISLIGVIDFENSSADSIVANMGISDTNEWVEVFEEVTKALIFGLAKGALRVDNPSNEHLLELLPTKATNQSTRNLLFSRVVWI